MSRTKMSIVIILCTIITVTAMIKPELFTTKGIKDQGYSMIENIKKIKLISGDKKKDKDPKVTYQDVAQSSEISVKDNDKSKVDASLKNSSNDNSLDKGSKSLTKRGIILTEAAKKNKLKELHESQLEDTQNYYSGKYVQKENSEVGKGSELSKKDDNKEEVAKEKNDKNEISVFKVSKKEIEDKLTLLDKQKILSVARKLSPSDYEKINKYLNSEGDEQGVIDAVKLLRDRLSDKDYEKIKEVAAKFLNMDVVESK